MARGTERQSETSVPGETIETVEGTPIVDNPRPPEVTNAVGARGLTAGDRRSKVDAARYSEGAGYKVGNVAPEAVYENEDGELVSGDVPAGAATVVVAQWDTVTPGIAARLGDFKG